MGNHRDLETILELYMPMIEHNSYLYGRLDEDLKQYILIHIALNISKLRFEANAGFGISEAGIFLKFSCRRVYEMRKPSVFTCVRHPRAYLYLEN